MDMKEEASNIIANLSDACRQGLHTSIVSTVVYDTAWVSMISKVGGNGDRQWLFPESFHMIVEGQRLEGNWGDNTSQVDGILNTMAALLALISHRNKPYIKGCQCLPPDVTQRISKAIGWLHETLQKWDVGASENVGFEILVPSLLNLLRLEGIHFSFPGAETLARLKRKKLAKFEPKMLYDLRSTTLDHSLEAFIGMLDFDQVRHHLVFGSMMASPSATAAFLMHASSWDDEAEAYLRESYQQGPGAGSGAFPGAFPTTIFELSWVLSTLLVSGYTRDELGNDNVTALANILESALEDAGGVVGFTTQVVPDADDTAKSILTLHALDRTNVQPDNMIQEFETEKCFRTFQSERNPSFSANCNILLALLYTPNPTKYTLQISKAVTFLCDTWWNGSWKDKWNHSIEYSVMLLSQAFVQLLHRSENGDLAGLPQQMTHHRVPVILVQIALRMLRSQELMGSWRAGSCEVTAYAIITLCSVAKVPWVGFLRSRIGIAVANGRSYLLENRGSWFNPEAIWVEKVSYSSPSLSRTYCLAALKASSEIAIPLQISSKLADGITASAAKYTRFFSQLPMFSTLADWELQGSLIEGCLFFPQLKQERLGIFPRKDMAEDRYLEYIPFTWTACNNLGPTQKNNVLWEMMIISMLNYQADEYMEAVVGAIPADDLETVKEMVVRLIQRSPVTEMTDGFTQRVYPRIMDQKIHNSFAPRTPPDDTETPLTDIERVLSRFIGHILNHPSVLSSPSTTQQALRQELRIFVLAHIDQIEDNAHFATQGQAPNTISTFTSPRTSYYEWVRTTSANHTSCPYSFVFFTCLLGQPGQELFRTAKAKYLAKDLVTHLATMCRMYNDYGSVARDQQEKNVNSVNFPEFAGFGVGEEAEEARRKADLLWLAEYERQCLDTVVELLAKEVEPSIMDGIRLFVNVTDLYGQIYVARDIASRMK